MDGTIINLDRKLGKVRSRVYRIGVELEGGWKKLPEGITLAHDGSVQIPPNGGEVDPLGAAIPQPQLPRVLEPPFMTQQQIQAMTPDQSSQYMRVVTLWQQQQMRDRGITQIPRQSSLRTGEIPSHIMEVSAYPEWMRKYYPSHVNATCGLHVHMSFLHALHYERLMVPAFQSTMLAYLTKWAVEEKLEKRHPIWNRLKGKSEYCTHEFFPELQASKTQKTHNRTGEGHRYTAVNYCWGLHSTLEVRVLPMMETVEQSIRGVQNVLDITNAYLVVTAKKEERLKAELAGDLEAVREHDHIPLAPVRGAQRVVR